MNVTVPFEIGTLNDLKTKLSWEDQEVWVIGKGPTLAFKETVLNGSEHIIAINHACLIVQSDIALFTDIEAFQDCQTRLSQESSFVLMPRYPHIGNTPRGIDLTTIMETNAVLATLASNNRLFQFETSNAKRYGKGPVIELRYFSAEPAYQVACFLGACTVVTLGIDGGSSYAHQVQQIASNRLLSNGRSSFDVQWDQFDSLKKRLGVPIRRALEPKKVFVGASDTEVIPLKVLEYSIKKYSSTPIDIIQLPKTPVRPHRRKDRGKTRFSLSRFLIPELMKFKDTAVYLDSDMLVFGDIADLFNYPLRTNVVGVVSQPHPPDRWRYDRRFVAGPQYSVMVIDCEKAEWNIQTIVQDINDRKYGYSQLLHELIIVNRNEIDCGIPATWNSLDMYQMGVTDLVHFTNVPFQPWRNASSDYFNLWYEVFVEAINSNFISTEEVIHATENGHITHSLIDRLTEDGVLKSSETLKKHTPLNKVGLYRARNSVLSQCFRLVGAIRNTYWRFRFDKSTSA